MERDGSRRLEQFAVDSAEDSDVVLILEELPVEKRMGGSVRLLVRSRTIPLDGSLGLMLLKFEAGFRGWKVL